MGEVPILYCKLGSTSLRFPTGMRDSHFLTHRIKLVATVIAFLSLQSQAQRPTLSVYMAREDIKGVILKYEGM